MHLRLPEPFPDTLSKDFSFPWRNFNIKCFLIRSTENTQVWALGHPSYSGGFSLKAWVWEPRMNYLLGSVLPGLWLKSQDSWNKSRPITFCISVLKVEPRVLQISKGSITRSVHEVVPSHHFLFDCTFMRHGLTNSAQIILKLRILLPLPPE
jgi:hypothetical protein